MAATMRRLAQRLCNGRLVLFQESGYHHVYIPCATLAIVEAVSGLYTGVTDPLRMASDTLQEWLRQAVEQMVATHDHFWKLS